MRRCYRTASRTCNPITVEETVDGLRVACKECKHLYYFRKDANGNPEKTKYAKVFKRDILQPSENLYYKYHEEQMHIL